MKTILVFLTTFLTSLSLMSIDYVKMYENEQNVTISKYKAINGIQTLQSREQYKFKTNVKLLDESNTLNKEINMIDRQYDSNLYDKNSIFQDESHVRIYHKNNYSSLNDIKQVFIYNILGESLLCSIEHVDNECIIVEANQLMSGTYIIVYTDKNNNSTFGKFIAK
jgi:hypothetical protein